MAFLTYERLFDLIPETNEFDANEFERYEYIASHIIKSLLGYQIEDLTSVSEFIKTQIETAVAVQIDYLYENEGATLGGSSFSLGKFSYGGSAGGESLAVAPVVFTLLEPTGLMYRGI